MAHLVATHFPDLHASEVLQSEPSLSLPTQIPSCGSHHPLLPIQRLPRQSSLVAQVCVQMLGAPGSVAWHLRSGRQFELTTQGKEK